MIEIRGFSPEQMILADLMWLCETQEEVQALVDTFAGADVVRDMLIAASLDDVVEIQQPIVDLLDRFRV